MPELIECKDEFAIYYSISKEYCSNVQMDEANLLKFWLFFKNRVPNLYKLAAWVLSFPTNTAEVERSIWRYNAILAKDRQSLKEENLKSLNFVQFNEKYFSKKKKSVSLTENDVLELDNEEELTDSDIDQIVDMDGIEPLEIDGTSD